MTLLLFNINKIISIYYYYYYLVLLLFNITIIVVTEVDVYKHWCPDHDFYMNTILNKVVAYFTLPLVK